MFVILTPEDHPLYERRFQLKKQNVNSQWILNAQFQLHSSIDIFEERLKSSKELFLKEIEAKQEYKIFGYVTPAGLRFLIMTDQEEEKVKGFCTLAHENLIKVLMNPLYTIGEQITSPIFDTCMQQLIEKKLNS